MGLVLRHDTSGCLSVAVNALPDDGVSSVCTVHSTTTQKPTISETGGNNHPAERGGGVTARRGGI